MSVRVMSRAFYLPTDHRSRWVLVALADHATDDGAAAYPGLELLQRKTGLSRSAVQRALAHLESHGVITAAGYRKGGRGKSTNWSINVGLLRTWATLAEDDPDEYDRLVKQCRSDTLSAGNSVACERKQCHLRPKTVSPVTPQPSEPSRNAGNSVDLTPFPADGLVAEFHRRVGREVAT